MNQRALTALALLLVLAGGGLAAAQDRASKTVTALRGGYGVIYPYTDQSIEQPWFCIYWGPPATTPLAKRNSYRVDWSLKAKGFRSFKQANTRRAGHVFISWEDFDGQGTACWDIKAESGLFGDPLDWSVGKTLRIRIRARYRGKGGPWTSLTVTRTADGYTSPDITLTNFSPDE